MSATLTFASKNLTTLEMRRNAGGLRKGFLPQGSQRNHREGRQEAWFVVNLSDVEPVFGPAAGSA